MLFLIKYKLDLTQIVCECSLDCSLQSYLFLMWIRNPRWPPTRALVFNKMIDGDPIGKWINTLFSNFAHG